METSGTKQTTVTTREEANVKLALTCPQCGAGGWTDLRRLKNGLKCAKCGCQFLVGSSGRLLKHDQLPQVRFACPRCKQTGSIPAQLAVRKAYCGACRLPLVAGPDQHLHGEMEAAQLWKAHSAAAGQQRMRERLKARFTTAQGRLLWLPAISAVVLIIVGLTGLGYGLNCMFDASPEAQVRDFTRTCLSGEWNAAHAFLLDDPLQWAEFDRWRVRHFSSLQDKIRPAGDRVEIGVNLIEEKGPLRVFEVVMQSKFMGTRTHQQHWRLEGETWQFDPHSTLAQSDGRE